MSGVVRVMLLAAILAFPMSVPGQTDADPRHKVILDVDIGIDDAFAVLLAHYSPAIDLLGVTTVFGNAEIDQGTLNGLHIKQKFGIPADVYRGAAAPLYYPAPVAPAFVHGKDGLGDVEGEIAPMIHEAELSAPEYIARTIAAHPGEITVVAVGPATNLILARLIDPSIIDKVKQVVVMGGAVGFAGERGNITTVAEANVWNDPHAMDGVFRLDWPVTMVGLDVTYDEEASMDAGYLDRLRRRGGAAGAFLERINRLYARFYESARGRPVTYQHDSIAVAYVIAPELFEIRRGRVRVITDGAARGQTVFSPEGHHTGSRSEFAGLPTHTVCSGLDGPGFLELYEKAIVGGAGSGG